MKLDFRVDNPRWAPDGTILAAGQTDNGTRVVTIDPDPLAVTRLLDRTDAPEFGAGTVAIRVHGELWLGAYQFPRIAVVRQADDSVR